MGGSVGSHGRTLNTLGHTEWIARCSFLGIFTPSLNDEPPDHSERNYSMSDIVTSNHHLISQGRSPIPK